LIRAVLYFVIWSLLIFLFNAWSKQQDTSPEDRALRRRIKMFAGPGIIFIYSP